MANPESVRILLRRISNLVEVWNAVVAGEFEDMSLVLDDVDVDVATLKRVNTSTGVNGVLVLIDLNDVVELVRSILVASEIVEIEPIGLSTLSCHNADALDISAGKLTREDLERRCAEVCVKSALNVRAERFKITLVSTIELSLLPGHEEVNHVQRTVTIDGHVNCSFFE